MQHDPRCDTCHDFVVTIRCEACGFEFCSRCFMVHVARATQFEKRLLARRARAAQ